MARLPRTQADAVTTRRLQLAQVLIGTALDHPGAGWHQITAMAGRRAAASFGRTDPAEFDAVAGLSLAQIVAPR